MNYGLDKVVENMECSLCEFCSKRKFNSDLSCDECPVGLHLENKKCVKHAEYTQILRLLKKVEDDIDQATYPGAEYE